MGIVDEITSRMNGQQEGEEGKNSKLLGGVMEMFAGGGGLQGLIQSFQQKGLGGIVSSWIGTGQNESISPDQVREGLGEEKLRSLAARVGLSPEEASSRLSEHLPQFVDKVTPDGAVPEGGGLQKAMELLKSKFF